jgi:IS5 family transposase
MRKKNEPQMTFGEFSMNHMETVFPPDPELEKISRILDDNPEILDVVAQDMTRGLNRNGSEGMTVEQVLRCAIIYQLKSYSYRELAARIADSYNFRKFTRFYDGRIPHFTSIEKTVKKIKPETFEKVNDLLVAHAIKKKVEDGSKLRSDTAVVETDIHHPTDARLLDDCVRVLDRLLQGCREEYPEMNFEYHRRTKRVKKRAFQIALAKGKNAKKKRLRAYRDLLKISPEVLAMAGACLSELESMRESRGLDFVGASFIESFKEYIPLAGQVIDQCRRRVIEGESVPADQKVVSIFEPHTDIIRRGKTQSPTEFGHKLSLSTGSSGLVTQYQVCEGNPGDGDLLQGILDKHVEQFGGGPGAFAGDRRFYSEANEVMASSDPYYIKYVSIPKPGRRTPKRKAHESEKWFKILQRFRAGIEGILSCLLRALGLTRCLWKGRESFCSYVGLSVVTFNLRKLAALL